MDNIYRIKIANVLRAAVANYTRGQVNNWLSRHLKDALYAEFGKDAVCASITIEPSSFGGSYHFDCSIWGSAFESNYDGKVFMCSYSINPCADPDAEDGWRSILNKDLDIMDCSDYSERKEDENDLIPYLLEIEAEVRGYEELINGLRKGALDAVKSLPVPKAAKIRAAKHFWDKPSIELKAKFPRAFDELIQEGQA